MSKIAHILAIKASSLQPLGFGISFLGDGRGNLIASRAMEIAQCWVGPRPDLETNEMFVQPIPYIMLRKGDKVLAYRRGTESGEARLHGQYSVGLGGHIDIVDIVTNDDGVIDLRKTIGKAAVRELEEEIGLVLPLGYGDVDDVLSFDSVISKADTPVDRVHIGFGVTVDWGSLAANDVDMSFEDAIENAEWRDPAELLAEHNAGTIQLEGWSELALTAITKS